MCIYILKIVNMAEETEINRQIRNHMIFTYAKEALKICQQINIDRCIGCQYNNASQRHHDCLTVSDIVPHLTSTGAWISFPLPPLFFSKFS